ncbi:MAG: TIGR02147 family protein [Bacteriovorax sp.]|nr:TIGR02147 family protein [Bacteriovorax sp.]
MFDVFSFDNYKDYLKEALKTQGHGSRLRFAEALNCQSAYISQVLNQNSHLSLEQAAEASVYFHMQQDEEDFFLLLIQLDKAASVRLREITKKKIKETREKRALLSNRILVKDELDEATQAKFFSKWYYAAIHMMITIPKYRDKESICSYLNLPMSVVNEAITFLLDYHLIITTPSGYENGKCRIFLKGDSPFVTQHHENWRLKAIEDISIGSKSNVHFSSIYSLSQKDFEIIKEKLLTHIQEVREIVRPSKEEEMCVFNLDFFKIQR